MTSRQEDLDFFSLFPESREESPATTNGHRSRDDTTGYRFHDNVVEELGGPGARCSRLSRYFELSCDRQPAAVALECEGERISYADLDQRANRLANLLLSRDIRAGSRVGILLNRSVDTYVALLGVTKTEATFVPIDPAAPADRLLYIAEDSALDLVVTRTEFAASTTALPCASLHLDEERPQLAMQPSTRPAVGTDGDPVCYIIYTSGSSGRPKGVAVGQSSICNFIGIVPSLYGVESTDRVYQGMTIAFDFSIEEIWVPLVAGATLVPAPPSVSLVGPDLAEFLALIV